VYAIANCRISIFRGTVKDEGGDEKPSNVPEATGVLASIEEPRTSVFSSSTTVQPQTGTTPRQVRALIGKVGSNVDVRVRDRILLEETGERYVVMNVTAPHHYGRKPDKVLNLKQVT
jgi:hypothetical protein